MIEILKRKDIDILKWNNCISKSSDTGIFAYSWYLDSCCSGWSALVKGDYESVFPLTIKSKLGIQYLYQPFFTRYLGVFSAKEISQKEKKDFLNAIPDSVKYMDFFLHEGHAETPEKVITSEKVYQFLNIDSEYSVIRSRYNENHLRNLKKAEKENLTILQNYDSEKVVEQFRIHQKEKQLGFEENDFQTLNVLMKSAQENTKTICCAVKSSSGEILSGAFFIELNNRILYLKGFSSDTGKKCGAMHFLFDKLIEERAGEKLVFDFGGSAIASVARFYKGFGAKDCLYLHIRLNRLPKIIKWLKQ